MAVKDGLILAGCLVAAWYGERKVTMYPLEQQWDQMDEVQAATDVVARTIWAEARGEGEAGMKAVASVIANRRRSPRWPNDWRGVCLQPWQFSCWNLGDPNRTLAVNVTLDNLAFQRAWSIAGDAVLGRLADVTGGATHYHSRFINAPYWTKGAEKTASIGNHDFYGSVA